MIPNRRFPLCASLIKISRQEKSDFYMCRYNSKINDFVEILFSVTVLGQKKQHVRML